MPPHASRTVFVANIPYDVSEEQIANVFSEVGPVSNVEIKFDPQTGRSKGYAFVQFYDEATAHSAVRNLQDVPINGRPVRIELSTDDGGRRGGPGGGPGRIPFGRRDQSPPRAGGFARDQGPDYSQLPAGVDLPPGEKATDAISKTLAQVNPGMMQDVMSDMKTLIDTQPEQARQILTKQPQLAYALFQAMLLMNIVDPSVLQRIQPLAPGTGGAAAPAPAAPAPTYPAGNAYPPYPPPQQQQSSAYPPYRPPPPAQNYSAPPPAPAAPAYNAPPPLPPHVMTQLQGLPEDQKNMLLQVLQLTPDQVSALDPSQRDSVLQLRKQFLGAA